MRRRLTSNDKLTITTRQRNRCADCDRPFTPRVLPHFDHNVPLADGGNDDVDNIDALCPNCHDYKTRKEHKERNSSPREENNPFDLFGSSQSSSDSNPLNFGSDPFSLGGSNDSRGRKKKNSFSLF